MPRGVYDRHKNSKEPFMKQLAAMRDEIQSLKIKILQQEKKISDLSEELLSCYRKLSPRA